MDRLNTKSVEAKTICHTDRDFCLSEMKNYNTLVIISHGNEAAIFHKCDYINQKHQALIDVNHIKEKNEIVLECLENKKIIAIACKSAKELGKEAFRRAKCKAYLGFASAIHFDKLNGDSPTIRYHVFIISIYKDVFISVIGQALQENWKFGKLKLILKLELKKLVTDRALLMAKKIQVYEENGIQQAVLAVNHVAENVILHGSPAESVT